jgi:hypothetical protein
MHVEYKTREEAMVPREKKQQIIDNELSKLIQRDGKLTVYTLVKEAENENHPLHKFFEWDDNKAARTYRRAQAQQMIQASRYYVHIRNGETKTVQYAMLKKPSVKALLPCNDGEHGHRKREDVLSDPEAKKAEIDRRINRLRAWCRECIDFEELRNIREKITEMLGVA